MTAKTVTNELLGKLSRKQYELFRRVKEGSLDSDVILSKLQLLIEGAWEEKRYESCCVTVDRDQTLEKMIVAGQYDWHNDGITSKHFPVNGSGQEEVEIVLVHRNEEEKSQQLIDEMDVEGYRLATHEELLALGAQHPELQRKFPIIALGTVVRVDDDRHVLCLGEWHGERKLDLDWLDDDWGRHCRFAFVRKS